MWLYRLLIILLIPVAFVHSIWLAFRFREPEYLLQRFALALPRFNQKLIWIHAASVGEVNACQSLIRSLTAGYPQHAMLVSTNTQTGKQQLQKLFGTNVAHIYMPFDITPCVALALKKLRPVCLLVVETEIWPNLFYRCHKYNIPLLIVNGRLSEKTLTAASWLKSAYRFALTCPEKIYTRSATDSARFIQLGARKDQVVMLGNLKYTVKPQQAVPLSIEQNYILVISSRDDEEQIIVKAWQQAATPYMLAIAPRHPHRKAEILQALSGLNLTIAVRSHGDEIDMETDVYLIDTLGELSGFIAHSEFVIIGGTFVDKGGQNLIEAAHTQKAIVFGPSMYNFSSEADDFLQHDAAIQANTAEALTHTMTDLSQNISRRDTIAKKGATLVASYQHILGDYLDAIKPVIDASDSGKR